MTESIDITLRGKQVNVEIVQPKVVNILSIDKRGIKTTEEVPIDIIQEDYTNCANQIKALELLKTQLDTILSFHHTFANKITKEDKKVEL